MSSHAIRLGTLFGIEIELDYTWFIILAVATFAFASTLGDPRLVQEEFPQGTRWIMGFAIALLLFLSVVFHEVAHSVVAKKQGLEISGITLFLFGGVSKITKEPKSPGSEFMISIVGPLTSLALAAIFGLAAWVSQDKIPRVMFFLVAQINVVLAIFNLLPGLPLDGGRIFRALLWKLSDDFSNATRLASITGQGLGYLMIFVGIWGLFRGQIGLLWIALIGWFLVQGAQSSYQQSLLRRALSGLKVSSLMTEEPMTVDASISLQELVNDYFMAYNYGAFPVMEGARVKGLITLSDVRAVDREKWAQTTAGEVAPELRDSQVISAGEDAWEAMMKMSTEGEGRLLVMEERNLEGILSRTNVMRLIRTKMELGT